MQHIGDKPAERRAALLAIITNAAGGFEVIASLTLFSVASVSMIILNKLIMTTYDLDYPMLLLFLQNLAALLIVVVAKLFKLVDYPDFDWRVVVRWIPLTLCFVVMLWSSMRSLSSMSVAAVTVLKFAAPVLTALGDSYFFGKTLTPTLFAVFGLMGFGGYLATTNDAWVTSEGLWWTFINIISTVAFTLYMKALLSDVTKEIGRWGPVFYNNLLSLPFLIVPTFVSGVDFYDDLMDASTWCYVVLALSLVSSAVISFASFWAMQQSGPTTFGVVGALNRVPMAFLGIVIFNHYPTTMGYVGITLSVLAGVIYAYITATTPTPSSAKDDSASDASAASAATSSPISMSAVSAFLFSSSDSSGTSALHRFFASNSRNKALIFVVACLVVILTVESSDEVDVSSWVMSGLGARGGGGRSGGSSSSSASSTNDHHDFIDFGQPKFRGDSPLLNGVMMVLLGGGKEWFFFEHTLRTLDEFVLNCFPYPLLVFHEGAEVAVQNRIKGMLPKANTAYHEMFPKDERHIVRFDDVTDVWAKLPHNLTEEQVAAWSNEWGQRRHPRVFNSGYRTMCRFWAGLVWNRKSLDSFDYYWRVDSDSAIQAPLRVDPFYFVFVKQKGVYGYNHMMHDEESVTVGLFDHFKDYLEKDRDVRSYLSPPEKQECIDFFSADRQKYTYNYNHLMYYNNFEMGMIAFKRHERFQAFFRWFDEKQPFGFYQYRWGDAPVHTLGVHLVEHCSTKRLVQVPRRDVPYWHQRAVYGELNIRWDKAGKCPRSSHFAKRWR